ncbi:MAG: hypothetical protein IH596_03645, partial [Bacteroidales bacterium]|nr:hypothetical protein [Bacteroidales bacterium]
MNPALTLIILSILTILLIGSLVILYLKLKQERNHIRQLAEKEENLQRIIKERDSLEEQITALESRDEGEGEIDRLKTGIELTLKKALKRAEEENFQKNTFLSNLSSEIRTPLNNIIGFASLLETETSLIENKELFEYARGISESGDRLISL